MLTSNSKEKQKTLLRPWIKQTTLPNSCNSSCEIIFLFCKISSWKYGKYKKRRLTTSVKFVWVKQLHTFLRSTVIIDKWSKCFQMFSNVFKCFQMFSNVFKCFQMFSNVFKCFQMFYIREANRRALLYFLVSQIFRKIFCKLKKLSYMKELMYDLITWSDWSMALKVLFFVCFQFENKKNIFFIRRDTIISSPNINDKLFSREFFVSFFFNKTRLNNVLKGNYPL